MDFSWNEQQLEFYEQALKFGSSLTFDSENQGEFPKRQWNSIGEFGLLGLPISSDYGGMDCDILTTVKVLEGFSKGCVDTGLLFSGAAHTFACSMPIYEVGNEQQKQTYLPGLCTGQLIAANAISEPSSGSDISSLKTRADKDGEGNYILNGSKCWVTNGSIADVYVVYATTNPKLGYLGQSVFLVPRDAEGITVAPDYEKTGLHSAPLNHVYFDDCKVPSSALLGSEGIGARTFANSMAWERCCLFSIFIGVMERDLERCIEFANEREQHGQSISRFQAVSHRIANMKQRLESSRLMLYMAAWQKSQNIDSTLAVALSKLTISEAMVQSGIDAIRTNGAMGYIKESGIDTSLLDGLGSILFSGTSDIQRELICHRLGLK